MKNLIPFVLFLILFSCKQDVIKEKVPQKTEGFNIIGNINEFNDKTVYLQEKNITKKFTTLKETIVKNNEFKLSGLIDNPKLLYLGFENTDHKIPFIANNFETFLNIDIKNLKNTKISGSNIQSDYSNYLIELAKAKNKFVFKLNYIKTNSNSLVSAFVLEQMLGKNKWRLGQNRKAYNTLSKKIKATNIGKSIQSFLLANEPLVKDDVAIAELSLNPEVVNIVPQKQVFKAEPVVAKKSIPKVKKIVARRKAINFSGESQSGGNLSLNTIRQNAKVTLIDFWASWCGPCRKSNPHLKQLYNKYHAKGFEIVGVSEDKEKDKNNWINAIAVDGLPWYQIIDDYGRIAEMYNVQSIPHTFLIDQNGGIIFEKKSTYTIERKLKEIFGF